MTRIDPLTMAVFAAVVGASGAAASNGVAASNADSNAPAVDARPPAAVAGPESGSPAEATALACFGGLEDGQAILGAGASAGRFGGTTTRICRANGGRALRALRSPAIAVGRSIVG